MALLKIMQNKVGKAILMKKISIYIITNNQYYFQYVMKLEVLHILLSRKANAYSFINIHNQILIHNHNISLIILLRTL